MYKKLFASFIILFVLMTFPNVALAQDEAVPQAVSGEVIPCPMPLAPGDVDGENVICGQIQVPENWEVPDGRQITITYARLLSYSLSPLADPIIYFMGGPGGSVLAAQGSSNFDFSYLRQTRDIIVWDQRGNRFSTDLLCPPEVKSADNAAFSALYEQALGYSVQDDPQALVDVVAEMTVEAGGTGNCPAYFAEQGINLSQYNTNNTVLDAIALMDHLAYPVYNLFGISYGTTVSLAIMTYYQTHPDAALPPLRSALIDGVAPLEVVTGVDGALTSARNIVRVFANCEADPACGAAYPAIRQGLAELLASLEAEPLTDAAGNEITLDEVIQVLEAATTTQVALAAYLPRMVDELARGETATFQAIAAMRAGEVSAAPAAEPLQSTNPLDVLTLRAAELAAQLQSLATDVNELGETSKELAEAIDEAETVVDLYVGLVDRYLANADPDVRNLYGRQLDALSIIPQLASREAVQYHATLIAEPAGSELRALVGLLTDDEIDAVWAALIDEGDLARLQFVDEVTQVVVRCNTQRPTLNLTEDIESLRSFEAPQLVSAKGLISVASMQVGCELYDVGPLEATAPSTITLDIVPTLVMNGGTDHATPVEWGEVAFETLDNARMITVPLTDHGVTRFSKCAKDIAHAFFLNPEMELVTSCVNGFAPVYILPDDALPGSAAQ